MSGFVTIDGVKVPINGQRNLLEMVRETGVDLPTFCYHSELSIYGACRMCVVEDGRGQVLSSCSTPPADGMAIRTNTPRLFNIRRMMLELLLANHNRDCTTCVKNGKCKLQDLCARYGVQRVRFPETMAPQPIDDSTPGIVRDASKCILCGDCVRVCSEVEGVGAIGFAYRGAKARVTPAYNKDLAEVNCVNCGQCAAICPTGALWVKPEIDAVWRALRDPEKTVVVQVAPAVRVAIGEEFGMPPGEVTTGKMVAALRRLGFDGVYDTSFTADLTTIEETSEFIDRLLTNKRLPQFTSCCPAWVKCAEQYYPEKLDLLSTCKSPQQMFGSLVKRFYARDQQLDPARVFVVSVMPCTAKKFEARRPEMAAAGQPDVDAVLSTQELGQMIRSAGIVYSQLQEEAFDSPFGFATGAGVIYGYSGGVATAVVREATAILTKRKVTDVALSPVAGLEGVRGASVTIGEKTVRVGVVSGLANARALVAAMDRGDVAFDIVEVMACPGGCVGGGGQPIPNTTVERVARRQGVMTADVRQQIRLAQDNPLIGETYRRWLEKPNSHISHETLHTTYGNRRRIQAEAVEPADERRAEIKVCVGTNCYIKGSRELLRRLNSEIEERGLDSAIDLRAAFCLENCDRGPCIQVNGHTLYGMRPDDMPDLIARTLSERKAQPVTA